MSKLFINKSLPVADFHKPFVEVENYLVGRYVGTSFRVLRHVADYDKAVCVYIELLGQYPDVVIMKLRYQSILQGV